MGWGGVGFGDGRAEGRRPGIPAWNRSPAAAHTPQTGEDQRSEPTVESVGPPSL